jgi:xanthine dehydrogenase YagR molybdenum-binding subunit
MLYGKILRSPHAHATIKKIDTRRAGKIPGVRAILTFQNIPQIPFWGGLSFILDPTVRFIGEEVACVIAEEEEICSDALEAVSVDYERLPLVLDPEEALKDSAPGFIPRNLFRGSGSVPAGDLEQGLAEAEVVVEDTFRTQTALHNSMKFMGASPSGRRSIGRLGFHQHVFGVRAQVAQLLRLPLHRVRVIKQFMGGGFGSKNNAGKYTLLAALGAKRTGRPVKIILDREEENLAAGNRPASIQYLKLGARRDGRLTALRLKAICAAGAYVLYPRPSGAGPSTTSAPCEDRTVHGLHQHRAFRFPGPGYVEGTFAWNPSWMNWPAPWTWTPGSAPEKLQRKQSGHRPSYSTKRCGRPMTGGRA